MAIRKELFQAVFQEIRENGRGKCGVFARVVVFFPFCFADFFLANIIHPKTDHGPRTRRLERGDGREVVLFGEIACNNGSQNAIAELRIDGHAEFDIDIGSGLLDDPLNAFLGFVKRNIGSTRHSADCATRARASLMVWRFSLEDP